MSQQTKRKTTDKSGSIAAFVLLEISSAVGILGMSMVFMLLPWTAINLSHSSLTAGLIISLSNVPGLVMSPVMGSFIDRFGRRRSAILMQFTPIITSIAFPLAAGAGWMSLTMLLALAIARGFLGGSSMSARKSLLPDTVAGTRISLERANGLHESIAAGGFAIGPALASVLITSMGTFNTFWVVAALEMVSGLVMVTIVVQEHIEKHDEDEAGNWVSYIFAGFKVVGQVPAVFVMLSTFTLLATVYLPTEMVIMPNYYASIHDAKTLGFLLFTMAIFTMVGSFLFESMVKRFSFSTIMRASLLGVALPMIPMSFLPPSWAMFAAGAVLGFAWGPLPPLVNTVIQRKVPPSQRGRVFSLEMTIWTAGPMISMSLVGWGVDALGVRLMYPAISLLVLALGILLVTRKSVRELNTAEFSEDEPDLDAVTRGVSVVPPESVS